MEIRPIRTDEDHRAALAAIEACWGAPEGTEEGDKLDVHLRGKAMAHRSRRDFRSNRRAPLCHRRARAYPGGAGRTTGLALACLGSSFTPARAHGRDDPQDRRGVENSGRPSCSSLQDRASRLSSTFADPASATPAAVSAQRRAVGCPAVMLACSGVNWRATADDGHYCLAVAL
jgi:hypothetical protein